MNKSESIASISAALAKAQAEIENASKSSVNPHFKSRYADLAEVLNTVRPVFSKHGIAIVQAPSFESGVASVETLLAHSSGEWLSNTCSAPVSKQDAQGVGSAITYLRRYSLAAFAGIAQEDDDAEASIPRKPQAAPKAVGKQSVDATRFAGALNAIKAGTYTAEKLRSAWALTDEQSAALDVFVAQLVSGGGDDNQG